MTAMLADQWYHQPGPTLTMKREALIDMLTKQTLHGMSIGKEESKDYIEAECVWVKEDVADGNDGYYQVRRSDIKELLHV